MFKELKKEVYDANIFLKDNNLSILTWGNVSAISDDRQYIIIKPSGISYNKMTIDDMVVVDIKGNVVEGNLNPSSDTLTHIEIYKSFSNVKSVVHTHSPYATSWAQSKKNITTLGTTHADHFFGDIPCTRQLAQDEIEKNYELNTGKVIVETFKNIDYISCPSVLVCSHGPFSWGKNCIDAVNNALILEEVAKIATITCINTSNKIYEVPKYLKDKHYNRKHGKNSYYGQK